MYARLTTIHCDSSRLNEIESFLGERLLPTLRLQPGFQRLLVLTDASHKLVTLTFWATEADEQATVSREYLRSILTDELANLIQSSSSESYRGFFTSEAP